MSTSARMAEVAALIGDPTRAGMLNALAGGCALTAGELASIAGVAASTVSGHLARLSRAGLVAGVAQGRHRYYRLASRDAARLLEQLMVFADQAPASARTPARIAPALRAARSCYDHLAGQLGVALADALEARGAVDRSAGGAITDAGRSMLVEFGLNLAASGSRRPECRACLDWSERRPHIAGRLGAALMDRTLALGWIERAREPRVVCITAKGRKGFGETFGLAL